MMSVAEEHRQIVYTPCRAQKCLFGPAGSSGKKSLQKSAEKRKKNDDSSTEDSDLGPISPLTGTCDSPSSTSSSPVPYASPLITPEKMSSPLSTHWDRLTPNSKRNYSNGYGSPFSNLKKITKSARYSPRRKILPNSPKSVPDSLKEQSQNMCSPERVSMTVIIDEIIPETPKRSFGTEVQNDTPRKIDSSDCTLITPMSSEIKATSLPRLHRRKSLSLLDASQCFSPEKKKTSLKRRAYDSLDGGYKLFKSDENYTIPKARAALFQEKETKSKLECFTLSTKSFYSASDKKENIQRTQAMKNIELGRRRSLPLPSSKEKKRSFRTPTFRPINAGVSHGIKRPRPKSTSENSKKSPPNNSQKKDSPNEKSLHSWNHKRYETTVAVKRSSSQEVDSTKRFFKTKKPATESTATITVNHKIKLKLINGKTVLNSAVQLPRKRQKCSEISFDASDLSVDEPEMEASVQQCKVDNILKVLEEDWADDDYDTMESLTNESMRNPASPKSTASPSSDLTLSPTSELSNMTSIMNIEDPTTVPTNFKNISFNDAGNNNEKSSEQKLFPIFVKGSSAKSSMENVVYPSRLEKRTINWQLSAKTGGGENQYQLDAGQKRFGATQCPECALVYQLGDPDDELAHLNYHNSRNSLKFPGWKTERVIFEDVPTHNRIILVEPGDSKQCWNKVMSILTVVDRDLGLTDAEMSAYQNKRVYLYIRDKTILGVLVAEYIETAHRMIPELLELDCCTAESTSAKCGINVIWTVVSHRRQGIATKLLDTLRANFYYGYVMTMDDIAFSIPTPSGRKFAEMYTKTRSFKVYS